MNEPPTATHELRPCAKAKASLSREARFGDDLEPDWPAHRSLLPGTQSLHRTHKPGPIRHPLLSWAALCFFLTHATPWAHTVRMLSPRLYRLSRHSPASTNTPIRLVLSERTRAVPTIRTVPAQQTCRAVGGSGWLTPSPKTSAAPTQGFQVPPPKPGSLLPPPKACRGGPVQFTPLPPVSSRSSQAAGTDFGGGGLPGKRAGVLSSVTPRASPPALPGPRVLLLHNVKARPDHRFVTVGPEQGGTRPSTPSQPEKFHFPLRFCRELNSVPPPT